MPRPLRTCSKQGCPTLVPKGACPTHAPPPTRQVDPAQVRYYGSSAWKKLRAQVRKEEPICSMCHTARSTNVDHRDGDWRNDARANLRALCTPCERSHTARQHGRKVGHATQAPQPAPTPKEYVWA